MTTLLFVYGTLLRRSRHPMARHLAARARYLGTARVRGRLYALGRYPGLLEPAGADDWVHGDLYDADEATLVEMDAYELAESPLPAYFERQLGEVIGADGTPVRAWIYWYRGTPPETQRIATGRYTQNCDPELELGERGVSTP